MPSPNSDLLATYDQAFSGRSWHGAPLWGSLRGLTPDVALRRPAAGRHNVWELMLHCAYWKFEVRRRITGDGRMTFPRVGRNFPALPAVPHVAEWKRDLALLKREHLLLRGVVQLLTSAQRVRRAGKSRFSVAETVIGVASHDLYHAGQVQLIRRLVG